MSSDNKFILLNTQQVSFKLNLKNRVNGRHHMGIFWDDKRTSRTMNLLKRKQRRLKDILLWNILRMYHLYTCRQTWTSYTRSITIRNIKRSQITFEYCASYVCLLQTFFHIPTYTRTMLYISRNWLTIRQYFRIHKMV